MAAKKQRLVWSVEVRCTDEPEDDLTLGNDLLHRTIHVLADGCGDAAAVAEKIAVKELGDTIDGAPYAASARLLCKLDD